VEESVTLTVKLKVPTEVVVPLTVPSLAKVSPVAARLPFA